jgi:hypothetical protein
VLDVPLNATANLRALQIVTQFLEISQAWVSVFLARGRSRDSEIKSIFGAMRLFFNGSLPYNSRRDE